MKVYGYVATTPDDRVTARGTLHRSLSCPSLSRAYRVHDASAWLDRASGLLQRSKYDPAPMTLCGLSTCVPDMGGRFDKELGACWGMDSEVFFPSNVNSFHAYREAKSVCGRCSVRAECLEFALEQRLPYGMYGGRTPDERKNIRSGKVKA